MGIGDKPVLSVTCVDRDKDKRDGNPTRIASGWVSKYGYTLSFPKGTRIRLPDGTVVDCDSVFFNVKIWDEPAPEKQESLSPEPSGEYGDDPLPF